MLKTCSMTSNIMVLLFLVVSFFSAQHSFAATDFKISGPDVVTGKNIDIPFPAEKPVVVLFLSAKCPCSASHEVLLKDFYQNFKDVTLIAIHSNADESKEDTAEHFKIAALPFPVIQDNKSFYADKWGALKTPHVFVLDKSGETLYQGGVTDSHLGPTAKKQFLKEVLEDLKAQRPLRHKEGRALGCYIQRETT